jgi:hypothetical protein
MTELNGGMAALSAQAELREHDLFEELDGYDPEHSYIDRLQERVSARVEELLKAPRERIQTVQVVTPIVEKLAEEEEITDPEILKIMIRFARNDCIIKILGKAKGKTSTPVDLGQLRGEMIDLKEKLIDHMPHVLLNELKREMSVYVAEHISEMISLEHTERMGQMPRRLRVIVDDFIKRNTLTHEETRVEVERYVLALVRMEVAKIVIHEE